MYYILYFDLLFYCVSLCVSSQGRHCEAVDQWELAKEEGATNVRLYASVMKMAAEVGGAEAARHVREDMEGQGWNMDHEYDTCTLTHTHTHSLSFFHITHIQSLSPSFSLSLSLPLSISHSHTHTHTV